MPGLTRKLVALLRSLLALTRRSTRHTRMVTPVIYDSAGTDPFADMPDADRTTSFDVFYATDRAPVEDQADGPAYGSDSDRVLHVGTASVTIGGGGAWADEAAATRAGGLLPADFVSVTATREVGVLPSSRVPDEPEWGKPTTAGADFAAAVNERLARSNRPDILVFVPGYKVDFEFPIRKATELWHFLGRQGALVAFPWTSQLGRFDYLADMELSAISSRNLRLLIEFLAAETSARRIHLLSHSTGTRLLLDALIQVRIAHLDDDADALRERLRLGQVVYAGAEVSLPVFGAYYGDRLYEVADQTTIYASRKDSALGLSAWLMAWQRLGDLDVTDLTDAARGFLERRSETCIVNVTEAEGATAGNGHWYFTSSPWVAGDLLLLLRHGFAPAERGLARHPDGPAWVFPVDYPARAGSAAHGEPDP